MKIGIDARLYNQTGVGRYTRNLIRELAKIDRKNEYYIYLRKTDYPFFPLPNNHWQKRILDIPWHSFKEQILVPFIFIRDNLDLVHFPYFNVPILYPKKFILTIHDLIINHFDTGKSSKLPYILYKLKRFCYQLILRNAINRALNILAISQSTKQEIINHYQVDPNKIVVTYDALDVNFHKIVKNKTTSYFNFPYLLYVGNAYPHKNLERLLDAFKLIKDKNKIKLVLVGEDDFFYKRLKRYAQQIDVLKDIVVFGKANDVALVKLYQRAKCLVFPSLMEGFGLPNLEALACGLLPVVSDIPAFREIFGQSLIYFNPNNTQDMAKKITTILEMDKNKYRKMVNVAKAKMTSFDWYHTAQLTYSIFQKQTTVK